MGRLLANYPSNAMYREPEEDIYDLNFIEKIEKACQFKLYLDFYGCYVCIRSSSIAMQSEFEYIFEMFLASCKNIKNDTTVVEFFFLVETSRNQEQSQYSQELSWTIANYCHDDLIKTVYRKSNNRFTKIQRYDKWPTDAMAIPPFTIEPLRSRFLVMEGNSLINSKDEVCLIVGDWWQGKTTLTALLLKMGYTFLSDGLLVIDRKTKKVNPYSTLCAFRHYNIPELGEFGNAIVQHPKTIHVESPNTGLIYLNHFSNFFPTRPFPLSHPSFIAICERNEKSNVVKELNTKDFMLKAWNLRVECGLSRDEFFQEMLSLHKNTKCFSLSYSDLAQGAFLLNSIFDCPAKNISG
jgi:hypothetical protein